MAQIRVTTNKARRTYPLRAVVGYRWKGEAEYEILECGHELEADPVVLPVRRRCRQCPAQPVKSTKKTPVITCKVL